MVKVTGPMFSLNASGTLADAVTFSNWKGRQYVRQRVIPANPKSDAQMGRRVMFGFLAQEWAGLPDGEKPAFKDLAENLNVSRFNAYVQFNMNRWGLFTGPSQQYPATETGTIGVPSPLQFFWSGNQVICDSTAFTVNDNWGCVLHIYNETGFTPGIANARVVIPKTDVAGLSIAWTPPKVETLYCRLACFTTDGVMGPAVEEETAAP